MSASNKDYPHLLFLPSGIGSLNPFFQLAVKVLSHNCKVTFINIHPQASASSSAHYSSFLSNHKEIELVDFVIKTSNASNTIFNDPFIIHYDNINYSVLHQLIPIISSIPVSAIFSDFALVETLSQISDFNIPLYIISTTSAMFFSTVAYLPVLMAEHSSIFSDSSRGDVEIPGLGIIPKSTIPPAWLHDFSTNYLLTTYLLPNARSLSKVKGILLNTFDLIEPETVAALASGRVLNGLPPVFPIGPLQSCEDSQGSDVFPWLDEQPDESLVYVNFGSREVMSLSQMIELGKGLEICGCNYLWVIQENAQDFSSYSFLEGTNNKGKIFKGRVNQGNILAHPSIGGFVNSCEWESVMYAAWNGVPMLAWPLHGDQKMNAETVEKAGLGISVDQGCTWKWESSLKGKDIGRMLNQIMGDCNIKRKVKVVKAKAREARERGGSSEKAFLKVIEMLKS